MIAHPIQNIFQLKTITPIPFFLIPVSLLVMQAGLMGGWSSPTLARLMSPSSPIPLSPQQASWVAALMNLGRLVGALTGPILASTIGSKSTISVTLWPITIGWLLVFLADSVEWLYGARVLLGIGMGMAFSAFPLYIGEVSMPGIRGALISLATVGAPMGQLVASVCGSCLSISEAASIYLSLALLLMFMFFWFPNSPHQLVKRGNRKGAQRAVSWYRAGRDVDRELEAVERFVTGNGEKSFGDKLREFRNPSIRRATFLVIALFTLMQICGLNSVIFYMETILINANCTIISPSVVVIGVNVCGTLAALVSIVLIDRCGRRFLLIVSSTGVTVSLLALSAHFYALGLGLDSRNFEWVPMASMFLFVVSFFAGMFPVPSAILSEIFPADIKNIAASVAIVSGAVFSFLSAKTYQPMVDYMGEAYVFLIYAIFASIVVPYTLIAVPETKGKSLQQIQDELMKK